MTPAPVTACRVLELGCGNGGNLISMAFGLPGSEFVGVDLSNSAIKVGTEKAVRVGLTNITLRALDILDFDPSYGEFDYIIAHGVYSWVPHAVREKLLAICATHLAPQGVAYISYNALPGGRIRQMLREMMQYHTRHILDPQERIQQARALLTFLANSDLKPQAYQEVIKDEIKGTDKRSDASLLHDDLSEANQPLYFHEFINQATRHKLQYLGEAHFHEMHGISAPTMKPESASSHSPHEEAQENRIITEQYADFLKGRRFRSTLLCRAATKIEIVPRINAVRDFYIATSMSTSSPESSLLDLTPVEFKGKRGEILETAHPLVKIAFSHLGARYPQAVSFDELLGATNRRLATSNTKANDECALEENAEKLCIMLLNAYATSTIELLTQAQEFVLEAGEHPCASRLARFELESGNDLSNLRHNTVRVEGKLAAQLLSLLDGTRDRAMLLDEMRLYISDNAARLDENGEHDEAQNARRMLDDLPIALEQNLKHLARLALLVAKDSCLS